MDDTQRLNGTEVPQHPLSNISRVVRFILANFVAAPVWFLLNPNTWSATESRAVVGLSVLCGGLLVVAVFLVLTYTLHRIPSLLFALFLPAIGVSGYALVSAAWDRGPYFQWVLTWLVVGLYWSYLLGFVITIPLAFANTILLRALAKRVLVPGLRAASR